MGYSCTSHLRNTIPKLVWFAGYRYLTIESLLSNEAYPTKKMGFYKVSHLVINKAEARNIFGGGGLASRVTHWKLKKGSSQGTVITLSVNFHSLVEEIIGLDWDRLIRLAPLQNNH